MGIFDVFTGKSAKRAAEQNRALYQDYQTKGLGELDRGFEGAMPELDRAVGAYDPVAALGEKYGQGTNLYMGALGLQGPEGQAQARQAFSTSPGYDFMVQEAIDRAQRAGARFSPGGNEIDAITRLSSGLANQEYQKWLDRLWGFSPGELSSTAGAAAGRAAGFGAKAGLYQTDAQNRVNLRGNVVGGVAGSNTAAANAQMGASANFWNAVLNLGGSLAGGYLGKK